MFWTGVGHLFWLTWYSLTQQKELYVFYQSIEWDELLLSVRVSLGNLFLLYILTKSLETTPKLHNSHSFIVISIRLSKPHKPLQNLSFLQHFPCFLWMPKKNAHKNAVKVSYVDSRFLEHFTKGFPTVRVKRMSNPVQWRRHSWTGRRQDTKRTWGVSLGPKQPPPPSYNTPDTP